MRRRRGEAIDGIVLLDKPPGRTSNDVLQEVKRLFNARKAGHTGSLDPMASGLLPVCLGEATKVSAFLLDADKHYSLTARFGQRTTTGDAEGDVLSTRDTTGLDRHRVAQALGQFRGQLEQTPPMYSAVKHQGQPLYKLARQGIEVERQPRPIVIYTFELLDGEGDEYRFELHCSKGTYVRTLIEDMGELLGCGGHVKALRRTGVGALQPPAHEAVGLDALREAAAGGTAPLRRYLLPLDVALEGWPAVTLSADMAFYVNQGQAVQVPRAPTSGYVRLYRGNGEFLGMGLVLDDGRIAPKRLLAGAGGR